MWTGQRVSHWSDWVLLLVMFPVLSYKMWENKCLSSTALTLGPLLGWRLFGSIVCHKLSQITCLLKIKFLFLLGVCCEVIILSPHHKLSSLLAEILSTSKGSSRLKVMKTCWGNFWRHPTFFQPQRRKSQFSKYILIYISSRFDVAYQEFQRQIDLFNDVFELDFLFIQFISWNFKENLR